MARGFLYLTISRGVTDMPSATLIKRWVRGAKQYPVIKSRPHHTCERAAFKVPEVPGSIKCRGLVTQLSKEK